MPANSRRGEALARLREEVARRVEASSLRRVARDVGMSPTGLQKFLDGAQPYSATRRKLERWYVRESAEYGGALSAGSAFAALRVLVQDLPPGRRPAALRRLLEALSVAYADEDPPPTWLGELRGLVERETADRGGRG